MSAPSSRPPLEHHKSQQVLDASAAARMPSSSAQATGGNTNATVPRSVVPVSAGVPVRAATISAALSSSPPTNGSERRGTTLAPSEAVPKERRLSFSAEASGSVQSKSPKNAASAVPDPRVCVLVAEAEAKNVTEPLYWRVKFDGHPVTSPASNTLQWKDSFTCAHSKDSVRVSLWAKKEAASIKLGFVDVPLAEVRNGNVRDEWVQLNGLDGKPADGLRLHVVVRPPHSPEPSDDFSDEEISVTPQVSRLPLGDSANRSRKPSTTPSPAPANVPGGMMLRRDTSHMAEVLKDRPAAVLEREKEWRKFFELPETDLLVGDWSAAFMKGVARHGRLFVFTDHLCFHSNLFGVKTAFSIPFVDVIGIEKTVENLTPGIKIRTNQKAYNFGGLYARVKCYEQVSSMWKGSYVLVDDSQLQESGEGGTTVTAAEEEALLKDESFPEQLMSNKSYEKDGFLGGVDELQELLSEDLPITPTRFFQLFVGNENSFEKEYHEARGDTDVKVTPWNPHEKFGTTRNVFYTLKLSGPIGPPTTRTEEVHRYHLQKDRLIIDTSMNMLDAPYGDYFRVESQWIVALKEDQKSSNVRISAKAVFSKSTIMKGTISSRTLSGMTESFKFWLSKAREVLNQKSGGGAAGAAAGGLGSSPSKSSAALGAAGGPGAAGASTGLASSASSTLASRGGGGGGLAGALTQLSLTNVLLLMNLIVNTVLVYALFKVINRL